MRTERCPDAQEFLQVCAEYLAHDPIRSNVVGSVATSVTQGFDHYEELWWWIVRDEQEKVVGAACRTAPFWLQLGPMNRDAATALARRVAREDRNFPGVAGITSCVLDFVDAFGAQEDRDHRTWRASQENVIYEAGEIRVPPTEGRLRAMSSADLDLALRWHVDFGTFIDGAPYVATDYDVAVVRAKIDHGTLFCWVVDDTEVSMVGHAAPVALSTHTTTRIGPVFTPEDQRRHGYASAATAVLTRMLQEEGHRVMLLADATYPTSNHIYKEIGYRALDHTTRVERE